jgi:hypothetical protein
LKTRTSESGPHIFANGEESSRFSNRILFPVSTCSFKEKNGLRERASLLLARATDLSFPNVEYKETLSKVVGYFEEYPGVYAVVFIGSLARGKAVEARANQMA